MRTKYLLTTLFLFLISTVFATRAADVTKVEKSIDGADMNITSYPDGSLTEVTDLTLTGTWNAPQVLLLRKALKTKEKPSNSALVTVIFDANAVINDMTSLFENCKRLVNITLPTKENTSAVSFKKAFSLCWYYGKGSPIDLSAFTNISAMDSAFYNSYNVESITMPAKVNATAMNFEYAFKSNLITEIDLSGFTHITKLAHAFEGAKNIQTIKLPEAANANPIDLENTFYGCGSLTSLDLTGFTNIINLTGSFKECKKLVSVKFPATVNTNEVSLNMAFSSCSALNTPVDLSIFPNITDINAAFKDCISLPEVTFSTTENMRELNFLATFSKTALTGIDLSMFPNITRLTNTFYGCPKLTGVKLSSKENTLVTDIDGLFENTPITAADISMFPNLKKMDRAFRACTNLKDLKLPAKANTNMVSVSLTFADCTSLDTPLDLSNFTQLTTLISTFSGCTKLPEIKLSAVENNTEMQLKATFSGCTSLTAPVDLSGFTNIIKMEETFNGCAMLQGVKMPAKEQSENVFFLKTFQGCTKLTEPIDLSAFKKITDISYTFKGCASLTAALFGGVPITLEEAFEGTNPNCLKYIPEAEQLPFEWTEAANVILNGKARADMLLQDNHPFYCPKAFELGEWKISYTRDFKGNFANETQGWNTICLPFDATLKAEGTGASPWGASKGYWLSELSGSISTDSIDFTEANNILANTPYIIALPGNSIKDMTSMEEKTITFSAKNTTIPATPENLSGKPIANYSLAGTYSMIEEQPMYLINRGTGTNADTFLYYEKGTISPFRAYLTALNPEAQNATSLKLKAIIPAKAEDSIDMLFNEDSGLHIYTLDGILTIDVNKAATIEINTIDGRMVRKVELNEGTNSIGNLNAGLYMVAGNKIAIGY